MSGQLSIIIFLLLFPTVAFTQIINGMDTLCADISNSFECARSIEHEKIKKFHAFARRSGDTLILSEKKSLDFRFRDVVTENPDSSIAYSLLDYIGTKHTFILHLQLYEGESIMLFNARSGEEALLPSMPLFAADSSLFAVFHCGLSDMNPESVLEIWRIAGDGYRKEFNFTGPENEWCPWGISWTSDGSLLVERAEFNADGSDVVQVDSWKLVKEGGKWAFRMGEEH